MIPTLQSETLRLRAAGQRQRAKVIRCLKDASDYRKNFTEHKSTTAWTDALIWEAEADADRSLLLIERLPKKEPVGIVELVRDTPDQITIALLVVMQSARLAGAGRQAVSMLAAHFRKKHTADLALGVAQKNIGAVAFWESLGFERTGSVGNARERLLMMARKA